MQKTSFVSPRKHRYNEKLRPAMHSRIYAILQRKYHGTRTDAASFATLQAQLRSLSFILEAHLMNLAKSKEEYSDLQDLEVRIDRIFKEAKERLSSSQRPAMTVVASHGIDALPDSLISQILLWLPTKESVKTSVLSTRWRNLWLDVPGLELDIKNVPYFSSKAAAINNVIDRFMESRLRLCKIKYNDCDVYSFGIKFGLLGYDVFRIGIKKLIAAVINRGVEHLDLKTSILSKELIMPLDIYKSKTLVSLKLANVGMESPGFVVSLPCLKIMQLENIRCSNGDPLIIEKLISGCPVLEDLNVFLGGFGYNLPVLRVRSQSLKRFCVSSSPWRIPNGKEYAVEIDAPRLKCMNFRDKLSDGVVVKNLKSLFMIDIDAKFNPYNMKEVVISDFLDGISGVRHMIISQPTLEILHPYFKQGTITKFLNLYRLEASFCNSLLQMLPDFLQSFPNLKHLTLCLVYLKKLEPENLELIIVPRCLLSTLECVEIKEVITGKQETTGMRKLKKDKRILLRHKKRMWMEAVRYILENTVFLKKLILCFSPATIVLDIFKSLDTFKKRSPSCEVFIRWQTSL